MNEQVFIVTLFALVACAASLMTWTVILYTEAKSKERDFWILFYALMGVMVSAWFGAGYALILTEVGVVTEWYFRPIFTVLISLFTGGGVIVYRGRLHQITVVQQQAIIEQLQERIKQLPLPFED